MLRTLWWPRGLSGIFCLPLRFPKFTSDIWEQWIGLSSCFQSNFQKCLWGKNKGHSLIRKRKGSSWCVSPFAFCSMYPNQVWMQISRWNRHNDPLELEKWLHKCQGRILVCYYTPFEICFCLPPMMKLYNDCFHNSVMTQKNPPSLFLGPRFILSMQFLDDILAAKLSILWGEGGTKRDLGHWVAQSGTDASFFSHCSSNL